MHSFSQLQELVRARIVEAASEMFGIELDQPACEVPPRTELGDLAFPVAFELAKRIKQATGEKRNPREIAEALRERVARFDFVSRAEVAGAGYLNVFYDRAAFLAETRDRRPIAEPGSDSPKVCVEHTSVNPNKSAHIGHARNSVLGDTFVRLLRASGRRVEVQNYIDNTGVQVADVVVGFVYLESMSLEAIRELDRKLTADGSSFDYYCWDLYARVGQEYARNEELKARRAEVLHSIEEGGNPLAELADFVATRNVECILRTMERLSIRYDLLPRESEILHLHFWQKAFEEMKSRGVIRFETEGKNAGCWVMPFDAHTGTDEHEADKILVRSNGTVTYTGKDIAYQMWKLGLLGMDFNYRLFHRYADGKEVWITSFEPTGATGVPAFGSAETVYNVIDTRQSYPQEVVKKGVATIFPERGEAASVHLSYEMVALSPAAAEELGFELSEDERKRTFVEMSGRKGLGVKTDDMIDRLEARALEEVESRHPNADASEKSLIARQIAVGALRYFLLKFTKNTVVVFDFREALALEGETGAYCQYTAVRTNSIFRKLEAGGLDGAYATVAAERDRVAGVLGSGTGDDIWSMLAAASRLDEAAAGAVAAAEPAVFAKYVFNLAKAFNLFYHNHRILAEPDAVKRAVLLVVADAARRSLTEGLGLLGIEVPERM